MRTYQDAESFVYFAANEDGTGAVKIGTSTKPFERFRQLQRYSGTRLALLGLTPGDQRRERQTHAMFAHLHDRHEWFRRDPSLMTFIRNVSVPWDQVG